MGSSARSRSVCPGCQRTAGGLERSGKKKRPDLKVGALVVVKPGITDPVFGIGLGGWQGRSTGLDTADRGETFVTIRWDTITLKNTPGSVIEQCEERGLGWTDYVLAADDQIDYTTATKVEQLNDDQKPGDRDSLLEAASP